MAKDGRGRVTDSASDGRTNDSRSQGFGEDLESYTLIELHEEATRLEIDGRADMDKDELIDAIRRQRGSDSKAA